MTKKSYFQNSVLRLQVMHDYVHWHCSIDSITLILIDKNIVKLLFFHTEMISA